MMKPWLVPILLVLVATPGLAALVLLTWYVDHHDTLLATRGDVDAVVRCLDNPPEKQRACAKQFQLEHR